MAGPFQGTLRELRHQRQRCNNLVSSTLVLCEEIHSAGEPCLLLSFHCAFCHRSQQARQRMLAPQDQFVCFFSSVWDLSYTALHFILRDKGALIFPRKWASRGIAALDRSTTFVPRTSCVIVSLPISRNIISLFFDSRHKTLQKSKMF